MTFKINKIMSAGEAFEISRSEFNHQNTFTILTGKNGSGKSNILAKAVNAFVFNKSNDEIILDPFSLRNPERIIAITTARFDRFPPVDRIPYIERPDTKNYRYLGINGFFRNTSINICSDVIKQIVLRLLMDDHHNSGLDNIFNFLGYLPEMMVQCRLDNLTFNSIIRDIDVNRTENIKVHPNDGLHLKGLHRKLNEWSQLSDRKIPDNIIDKLISTHSQRNMFLTNDMIIRFDHHISIDFTKSSFELEFLSILLHLGIIKIREVFLSSFERSLKREKLTHLSSGQLCLLLSMSFLASSLTNNSLVCIDEPENSLHPEWQAMFIKLLQTLASNYQGCHFIIATHSPQVVSGINDNFSFINDLERNNLLPATEFRKRSADYQLSELFNAPGYRNEYLIRISLVILSKISKREVLSDEDHDSIIHIKNLVAQEKISPNDPVYHLIQQIVAMVE